MSNMAVIIYSRPCAQPKRRFSPLTKGLLWGGALSGLLWAMIGWMVMRIFF